MKRVKLLVTAALLAALSLTLCSCNWLDTQKANRAEMADGNIVFNGHTYYPTDIKGVSNGTMYYDNGWFSSGTPRLVDADIPLLLTDAYGEVLYATWDNNLLQYNGAWYAIDTLTEAEIAALQNPVLDHYTMYYWGTSGVRFIDSDLEAAIKAALAGKGVDEATLDTGLEYFVSGQVIYPCDEFGYFLGSPLMFRYYESGAMYLYNDGDFLVYEVPEKYRAVVETHIAPNLDWVVVDYSGDAPTFEGGIGSSTITGAMVSE